MSPFSLCVSVKSGKRPGISCCIESVVLASGSAKSRMRLTLKLAALTGSEKVSDKVPASMSSPKLTSVGGVSSSVKFDTRTPLLSGISITGLSFMSVMVSIVNDR